MEDWLWMALDILEWEAELRGFADSPSRTLKDAWDAPRVWVRFV